MSQTGASKRPPSASRRQPPRPAPGAAATFTLVEVLLAITILAIGLGGVLAGYANAATTLRRAQDSVEASLLLKERMAGLELQFRENNGLLSGTTEGECDPPFHLYAWQTEVRRGPDEGLLEVSVTIRHLQNGRSYTLSTYFPAEKAQGVGSGAGP